jgi:hypothetical protein
MTKAASLPTSSGRERSFIKKPGEKLDESKNTIFSQGP